jgi:hypothetical protein
MADKAINVCLLVEIVLVITPAITGVTPRTGGPVPVNSYAEIVYQVLFADLDFLPSAWILHGIPQPLEVSGGHNLLGRIWMAG